jgi:type IV secretory pathway VirB6-like protein
VAPLHHSSFAGSITEEVVVGPRDRVRKFKSGGADSEIDYKYSTTTGFSCKPKGLKFFATDFTEKTDNDSLDSLVNFGTYSLSIVINLLLAPVLCISTLKAFGNAAEGNGMTAALEGIAILIGLESIKYLEELIYNEDDYNLDPYNPLCFGVTVAMFVSCIGMLIVTKLPIGLFKKLLIIEAMSAIVLTAKEIIKGIQYNRAKAVFDKLSLCGDDWFTYGSPELEEEMKLRAGTNNYVTFNNLALHFPMKGSFFGSHSYKLNECFRDRNPTTCNLLFRGVTGTATDEDIDAHLSVVYKQFREFLYGGIEYAYEACRDPRIERVSYMGAADKTSQLYYFRGSDAANFACERFLVDNTPEYKEAYKCCLEASQKLVCIHNSESIGGFSGVYVMCNKDDSPSGCKIATNIEMGDVDTSPPDSTAICTELKKVTVDNTQICSSDVTNKSMCSFSSAESTGCCEAYKSYENVCDSNGKLKDEYTQKTKLNSSNTSDAKMIKLKIVQSKFDPAKYCVETYSFCPYNFRIGGGTEIYGTEFSSSYDSGFQVEDVVDENDVVTYRQKTTVGEITTYNRLNECTFDSAGNRHCMGPCFVDGKASACYNRPSNFCQLDRHCVKIPKLDDAPKDYNSPYIDLACINSVGSSHNFDNYANTTGRASKSTKLLVAPLVECTVETFKNILMNKAGHTRCMDANEDPTRGDDCSSGVVYKRGQNLDKMAEYKNSFKRLKNYMIGVVTAVLALAVMLFGYNLAFMHKGLTTEEISKFVLKMICVSYFAISTNWIPYVFSAVYRVYGIVAEFALGLASIDEENMDYTNLKYSGCYFFKNKHINNNYDAYGDRQYVSVFDTLDCKLSRYFGYYTNNMTNPPILALLIMGVFSFGLAILMILPVFLIFLSLFFFIIRAAYIFIVNSLTITILLFLSPIFIPLVLFEKTKSMFSNWLVRLAQNVMSPLFLFMSLSLFFAIFDKYYIGDAKFKGTREPIRDVYCGELCKISETNFFSIVGDDTEKNIQKQTCNEAKGKVIDLIKESPICMVSRAPDFQTTTSSTLVNFILKEFGGFPGFAIQIANFFLMFSDIIFMLVLIFIFEELNTYISEMTSNLFSYNSVGFKGIDSGVDGLPKLKEVMKTAASGAAKLANATKEPGKAMVNKARNKIGQRKEDNALK